MLTCGVRIDNSFDVAAPPEAAWELLMDVPRVIPCMPGAALTETVDEDHWKATIVSEAFAGQNLIARHRLVMSALAEELKGPIHALTLDVKTPAEIADSER